jgi:uncharacterized phosphosugar-binding protein
VDPIDRYHQTVSDLLHQIATHERGAIERVGGLFADVIARDRLIYVFGTGGHSYMAAEEMTWRAGGLAAVHPVLDPGVSLGFGARRSTAVERTAGYARAVLGTYPITAEDILLIVNAWGINACTIDAALWAAERGITTVAITSPSFARQIPADHPARHPTGRNLADVADHVIDCRMPLRDAVLQFATLAQWVSPVSTILVAFVIEMLVGETVRRLLERGVMPPVWTSANIPGGDEANRGLVERYSPRIRWL